DERLDALLAQPGAERVAVLHQHHEQMPAVPRAFSLDREGDALELCAVALRELAPAGGAGVEPRQPAREHLRLHLVEAAVDAANDADSPRLRALTVRPQHPQ